MKRAHFVAWNTQQWEARKLRENILGRINFLPNCLATSHFLAMRYREIEKRRKHGEREAEIYIATGLITESLSHYKVISIVIVICCCVSSFSFLWALLQSHSLSLFVLFSMHLPPPSTFFLFYVEGTDVMIHDIFIGKHDSNIQRLLFVNNNSILYACVC